MPQSPKSEDDEFEVVNPRKVPKNRARIELRVLTGVDGRTEAGLPGSTP